MTLRFQKATFRAFFLVAVLVLGSAQAVWAGVAAVQNIQGEVFVLKAGADASSWTKVESAVDVENGDSVKTQQGTCVLQYGDIASFAVEANSIMVVKTGDNEDLSLMTGKIRAKVDKSKVIKPFRVITPTAVAAIRGTEVDFAFNDDGNLTIDLHNGNIQVVNDEVGMKVDLGGKKSIIVFYSAADGVLKVRNECGSDDKVTFSILGTDYIQTPCSEQEVKLDTAAGPDSGAPGTAGPDSPELPDDHDALIPQSESPVA